MHVGKLLSVIDILRDYYGRTRISELTGIDPEREKSVLHGRRLAHILLEMCSRVRGQCKFSPSQLRILEQIGASQYLPDAIENKLAGMLATRDEKEPLEYLSGLKNFVSSMDTVKAAFDKIGIAKDEVRPGEAEVGVGIAPKQGTLTLEQLRDEARDFDRALRAFSEVAGEAVESPKLRVISSSWFEFFMLSGPAAALLIASTIERIVSLYKSKLEIEKLRNELDKQKVPKASIQPLKEHEDHLVEKGLNELAESFLDKKYKGPAGRKNELRTSLHVAMRFLAEKIDHGVSIEVAVRKLEPPKRKRGKKESEAQAKEMKAYKEYKKMVETTNRLGYAVAELDPARKPVLMLPAQKRAKRTKKKVETEVNKKAPTNAQEN